MMPHNKEKPMKYYLFRQNNSGGHFDINDMLAPYVFVQAKSKKQANKRAKRVGIYFDGCDEGRDCPCCGDRWSNTISTAAYTKEEMEEFISQKKEDPMLTRRGWHEARVHHDKFFEGSSRLVSSPK
jgi:hypothetical protein